MMMTKFLVLLISFLSLTSISYASTCSEQLGATALKTSTAVNSVQVARWKESIDLFLDSKNPDYEKVRSTIDSLEKVDTTDPQVQEAFKDFSISLKKMTEIILSRPLPASATLQQIQATANKLRLLNMPSLRNLLPEDLQNLVAVTAWTYNRTLWNEQIGLKSKIQILKQLSKLEPQKENQAYTPSVATWAHVSVVHDDLMSIPSQGILSTVGCKGYCSSAIHFAIQDKLGSDFKLPHLKDGESTVVRTNESANEKTFVLIADDQKLPLSQIILNGLLTAESAGLKSVVLPALRTGDAFGSVETSYGQVIFEILKGVDLFFQKSNRTLTEITVAIPRNQKLAERLQTAFGEFKVKRERSLRENLRPVSLSGRGFLLSPSSRSKLIVAQNSPIYKTMLLPWDLTHMLEIHAPLNIGRVVDRKTFNRPMQSVLNMPIKMPQTGFRIPIEHEPLREFLQKILDHEIAVNPDFKDFYAYLTVDHSYVEAGRTHRQGGIHIDGVQGARYATKLVPEHTYSISNTLGTVFYNQVFDLTNLDPARQHVHAELERQAKHENRFVTQNFEIYFWDSYSAHEADIATQNMMRTFVRVEFSKKIYDGVGDTVSPLFDYNWNRIPRPIPPALDDRPVK